MRGVSENLWYLLVDQSHEVTGSVPSPVVVSSTLTISELKEKIYGENNKCGDVAPRHLSIYRPNLTRGEDENIIQNHITKFFATNPKPKPLSPGLELKDLDVKKKEVLLVELPKITVFYALVDQSHQILCRVTPLNIDNTLPVSLLVAKIMAEQQVRREVNALHINLYRSRIMLSDDDSGELLHTRVRAFFEASPTSCKAQMIYNLKISDKEILLVEVPDLTTECRVPFVLVDCEKNYVGSSVVSAHSVADFRTAVKEAWSNTLHDVDAGNLVVWQRTDPKLSASETPESVNFTDDTAVALKDVTTMVSLCLSDERLIVQMPATIQPLKQRSSTRPSFLWELRKQQLSRDMTPSSLDNKMLLAIQSASSETTFGCSRPPQAAEIIPVTLSHPILNEFDHDCKFYTPTRDDCLFAHDLSLSMSCFFPDEIKRQEMFFEICETDGGLDFGSRTDRDKFHTDGCIVRNGWPCLVTEVKLEAGFKGAEPVFQGIARYRAFLQDKQEQISKSSNFTFPCVGMYVIGPLIGFFVMAFTTRFNMQMVGQTLRFDCHITDMTHRTMIARHLGALRNAVKKLEQLYDGYLPENETGLPPVTYPAYSHFDFLDGSQGVATYSSKPVEDGLLFFGTFQSNNCIEREACIKFVKRYSLAAHEHCAREGFAPKLIGHKSLPGEWTMVVMDIVDDSFQVLSDPDCLKTDELQNSIKRKLEELHQKGYVHGDIRDVNIMVKKDSGDRSFMLLDFDWAGEIGTTCYPFFLRSGPDLWRPEGAIGGEIIKAEHDIDMLEAIFHSIS